MKKIFLILPLITLIAAGCNQRATQSTQAPDIKQQTVNQLDLNTQFSNKTGNEDILIGFHPDLKLPTAQQTMKVNNSDIGGTHGINVVQIGLNADQAISFFKSDLGQKGWQIVLDKDLGYEVRRFEFVKGSYKLAITIQGAGSGVDISIDQSNKEQ